MLTSHEASYGGPSGRSGAAQAFVDRVLVAITLIAGLFLPVVSSSAAPGGLINIPWGSLYGLGFAALHLLIGSYRGGGLGFFYGITGFAIWPALVAFLLAHLLKLARHAPSRNVGQACRLIILLSLLVSVPVPKVQGSVFNHFPLFTKYIDF